MCYKELNKRFAVVHGKKVTKIARVEATALNSLTPLSKAEICKIQVFIRLAIQAIRYSGGHTRQFAGDGIMGIFQGSNEDRQILNGDFINKCSITYFEEVQHTVRPLYPICIQI